MTGTFEIGLLSHVTALSEKPSVSKEYADSRRKPAVGERRKAGHQISKKGFMREGDAGENEEPLYRSDTGANVDITL
jgi:hypothetical protein